MTFIPQDPNIEKSCLNACTKEAIEAGVCNCLNKVNIKQFDIPVVVVNQNPKPNIMKWAFDNLAIVEAVKALFDNDSGKIVSKEGQRIIDEDGEELRKLLKPKSVCQHPFAMVKQITREVHWCGKCDKYI